LASKGSTHCVGGIGNSVADLATGSPAREEAVTAVTGAQPTLNRSRTAGLGSDGAYAGCALLSFAFVWWLISEPKGQELEAIPEEIRAVARQ